MRSAAKIAIIATAVIALALLPQQLGGVVGYYHVSSGSMEPNVPRGSLLIAHPPWLKPPKVGDVVIYRSERLGLVAHRVVEVAGRGYLVKADVGGFSELVPPDRIVGVAVLTIPMLGWLGILAGACPLIPFALLALLIASLIPGRGGSLYPIAATLSVLPLLLPVKPQLAIFGRLSGVLYSSTLALGIILAKLAERRSILSNSAIDAAYALLALASASAVRLPW